MRVPKTLVVAIASLLILAACGNGEEAATEGEDPGDGSAAEGEDPGDELPEDDGEGASEPLDGDPIRVAYLETGSSAPMYLTAEKYAEEVGIELEMTRVASGNESITGVATGQFDVGFAGIGSGAYNALDEGLPVRFVAPMHAGYVEDYFIISSTLASDADEAAELAEDMSHLAGESFAVNAPGVVTEALLGLALERVGLSFEDIDLEYIPFPDQVPALANGGIAAAISSEPFPTAAEGSDAGYRPWDTPDEEPMPFTGILYNSDWAEDNPELAEAYMRAFALAAADLAENGWDTDEVLGLLEQYTGSDPDVIAAARQHHIPADLSVDMDVTRGYQEFYMEQGSLNYSELIPEEELWDFSWRDAVLGD